MNKVLTRSETLNWPRQPEPSPFEHLGALHVLSDASKDILIKELHTRIKTLIRIALSKCQTWEPKKIASDIILNVMAKSDREHGMKVTPEEIVQGTSQDTLLKLEELVVKHLSFDQNGNKKGFDIERHIPLKELLICNTK